MSRPGYLNYKITGKREAWLVPLCERLNLEPNHFNYAVAIDAALAAMVAGLTENQTKGEDNEHSQ